ncbi:MAG: hypothetical protein NTW32_27715 [Chloroflexi bacterium]|nr:hypothetical protein [Chloroflexota bacterium]
MKINQLQTKQKLWIITCLVGVVSFVIASSTLRGFLQGDDEALFMTRASQILVELHIRDIHDVGILLVHHDHPPFPILILAVSIATLGFNIIALRLPNVLLWVASTMVATRVGWRVGGLQIGALSGIFLAISGIYDIETLGFGMSVEVLSVLLFINTLLDQFEWNLETPISQKKYALGAGFLALGYLFYTSTTPIIGVYHLLFAIKAYKANPKFETIKRYIYSTLPFIAFYVLYNLIFLGIPAYEMVTQGIAPYGQLAQNLGRASSPLNYTSLLFNLKVMNCNTFANYVLSKG